MRKNRNFLGLGIFLAVLMLAVGYAAINDYALNITGTASATPSDASFVVKFDETAEITKVGNGTINASVTDNRNASLVITGLTTKGQTASATYTIVNESVDLVADITKTTAEIVQSGDTDYTEYFSIDVELGSAQIAAGGATTTVKVTVTVEKTPVDVEPIAAINVALNASVAS